MIIKMKITFDYNPETNVYTPLKQEVIKEKPAKQPIEKQEYAGVAQLTLLDNKYVLNQSAVELLGAKAGDKIAINFKTVDGLNCPIIAKSDVWQTNTGNKLTKQLTVSCRGIANQVLREYGDKFNLIEYSEGFFILDSGKDRSSEIKVEEPDNKEEDKVESEIEPVIESEPNFDDISFDDDLEADDTLNDFDFEI